MARSISDSQVAADQACRNSVVTRMNEVFADVATVVCLSSTVASGASDRPESISATLLAAAQQRANFDSREYRKAANKPTDN
jgi:hypothetical protein